VDVALDWKYLEAIHHEGSGRRSQRDACDWLLRVGDHEPYETDAGGDGKESHRGAHRDAGRAERSVAIISFSFSSYSG
jgi:hypothetical protein